PKTLGPAVAALAARERAQALGRQARERCGCAEIGAFRRLRLRSRARRIAPRRRARPHHRSRARDAHRARRGARGARSARDARRRRGSARRRSIGRRADQSAAPQDRIRPRQSALADDGARPRLSVGDRAMTLWSASSNAITPALKVARAGARDVATFVAGAAKAFVLDRWPARQMRKGARAANQGLSKVLSAIMPKGLYVRALVIVIAPMVLLQSILAYVFMERHWQTVTERLSAALSQDIAALVDLDDALGPGKQEGIERIAAERLNLDVEFMPPTPLPSPAPKPFFQFFDEALAKEIR